MKYSDIARQILGYFNTRRQVGHTTAVLKGALPTDAVVIFNTQREGEQIRRNHRTLKYISLNSIEYGILRGRKDPLVLDNHTIEELLAGLLKKIDQLEKDKAELISRQKSPRSTWYG